jgi:hypothetical protein
MFARAFGLLTVSLVTLSLLCGQPIGRAADDKKGDKKDDKPPAASTTKSLEQLMKETGLEYEKVQKGDKPPFFRVAFNDGSVLVSVEEIVFRGEGKPMTYQDGEPMTDYYFVGKVMAFEKGQKPPIAAVAKKVNELNLNSIFGGYSYHPETGVWYSMGVLGRGMHPQALRENIRFFAGDIVACRRQLAPILKAASEEKEPEKKP